MHGNSAWEPNTSLRLHRYLSVSRVGQRWERIVRAHSAEIEGLIAVHPDVREHAVAALYVLVAVSAEGTIDDAKLSVLSHALDDFERLGGIELRQTVEGLRDELELARGRTLAQVLH